MIPYSTTLLIKNSPPPKKKNTKRCSKIGGTAASRAGGYRLFKLTSNWPGNHIGLKASGHTVSLVSWRVSCVTFLVSMLSDKTSRFLKQAIIAIANPFLTSNTSGEGRIDRGQRFNVKIKKNKKNLNRRVGRGTDAGGTDGRTFLCLILDYS